MKKSRDDLLDELQECASRISLLEKVVGYKLRKKMLSWESIEKEFNLSALWLKADI